MVKTTTIDIELAIMKYFDFRRNLIVPGVTSMSGLVAFEIDILVLTQSGYASAFEIKVSKWDLKADKKKNHIKNLDTTWRGQTGLEIYYDRLKYFSYAVPVKLKDLALEEIPSFCGLYAFEKKTYPKNYYYPVRILPVLTEIRKPKILFNYKWIEQDRYNLARLGALRIFNLKKKINGRR